MPKRRMGGRFPEMIIPSGIFKQKKKRNENMKERMTYLSLRVKIEMRLKNPDETDSE
jgi:UV DNA damage repair endonuclease